MKGCLRGSRNWWDGWGSIGIVKMGIIWLKLWLRYVNGSLLKTNCTKMRKRKKMRSRRFAKRRKSKNVPNQNRDKSETAVVIVDKNQNRNSNKI
jgi:hypothetical protein